MNFKFIYWGLVSFFLFVGCENKDKNDRLSIMVDHEKEVMSKYIDYQKIAVLTENGCLTCNESMAKQLDKWLGDSTVAIVIEASGVRIDISNIVNNKQYDNVFIDMKAELSGHFKQGENSFIINKSNNRLEITPITISNVSDFQSLIH